ncbi:MAG: long-chain fatty acid--CoA ligase [Alphaproteobacteria bacterium]|nr:long-chain fatty acid--CoA ligase [Alphaproteobacteria bacterium]
MLLSDVPALAAHHAPDIVAVHFAGRSVSYGELHRRCNRLSNALLTLAEPGSRVAILAENCLEYVDCYYGVPGASMALTLLNYRLTPRELVYILNDSAPEILIAEPKYRATLNQVVPQLKQKPQLILIGAEGEAWRSYDDLVSRADPTPPALRPQETDLCWLLYTSGTTGLPKGAMLSHRNLMAAVYNSLSGWDRSKDDVCLFTFPQFHVAGYVMPIYHLQNLPVVLLRNFDTETMLRSIEEFGVTSTAMAPTMIAMLLDDARANQYDLSSLRRIGYGASSMPVAVLKRARERWPNIDFSTGFGMTELAGNVMFMGPEDHRRAALDAPQLLRSVGRQLPLARVRVIDDMNRDCPPGVPGEIVIKGDQVLTGYWNNPEATQNSFIDGWFRSGDIGEWDENGYLYVVDRKKDMILTGGENVYPREVEEVLYQHPAIAEVAVAGRPDQTWGEAVVAFVVLRDGSQASAEELIGFCREQIASYKKPRHVVFIDTLPKNASGKVLKRELRERLMRGEFGLKPL